MAVGGLFVGLVTCFLIVLSFCFSVISGLFLRISRSLIGFTAALGSSASRCALLAAWNASSAVMTRYSPSSDSFAGSAASFSSFSSAAELSIFWVRLSMFF